MADEIEVNLPFERIPTSAHDPGIGPPPPYIFPNPRLEELYREAVALLASEDERQKMEAERLSAEWARYPDEMRREKIAWLERHFRACRAPYLKVLTEIVACASPVMILRRDS